ncbi:hypothetical protein ORI89_16270 [Sphingobacterium sp. UT-1RO-CII-1]|uniref:hypothetical protein n=1 Tax=Sphingobacterium sp. UT-1RO-CII-1 TaxID=2995225 RepID=UPI00227A4FB5|nr:hypothetical protein [Sphingobacterium sp. UT-1RO-CII-1]MCY4781219.1 hypothetical protein [Sphingobacterium sp. UT-1RO-CII-1]
MKGLFLVFALLFSLYTGYAQIRFVDRDTGLGVPAVNIYSEKGTLLGFTDKEGVLSLLENVDQKNLWPLKITVQHISYEQMSWVINSAAEEQTYSLSPRSNIIEDIAINATTPKEVIVLKGYYRSLETFDLKQKYFVDGIMEYYIPIAKGKPKYRLLEYRVFQDSALLKEYNEKMGPFFQIPRVPKLVEIKLSKRLSKLDVQEVENGRTALLKEGKKVGYITQSEEKGSTQFYIDMVLPDSVKKEKIFRLEARTKSAVQMENYSSMDIEEIDYRNLQSIYQNIVATIKRKSVFGRIPYESLNEFYVIERSFISMAEYKEIEKNLVKSIYKTVEKSSYKNKFWENLDEYNIPPVQEGLQEKLGGKLQFIK